MCQSRNSFAKHVEKKMFKNLVKHFNKAFFQDQQSPVSAASRACLSE